MPDAALEGSAGPPSRRRPRRGWASGRVVVHDSSMAPTLLPGDRLKVDLRAYREHLPTVGDVVVLVDPDAPERWLVKRVAAVDPLGRTVDVRGDAGERSRDSRRFGPVPVTALVGRAFACYAPAERRRAL
jgi:nickel-type superoxide dismutase maturation protease